MSTDIVRQQQPTAVQARAPQEIEFRQWAQVVEMTGYSMAQIALIRQKQGKDPAPPAEMMMFLHAAKQLALDPLSNQCYWIRRNGKGALQVGIDGFRLIAARSGAYAGSAPAVYRGTLEVIEGQVKLIVPEEAQVVVWRIVQGRQCSFTGVAHWTEFYPGSGPIGAMYRNKPRLMLAKDAEAQALRKGFAAEMIGMPATALDVSEVPEATVAPPPRQALTAADYDRLHGAEERSMLGVTPTSDPRDAPPELEEWEPDDEQARQLAGALLEEDRAVVAPAVEQPKQSRPMPQHMAIPPRDGELVAQRAVMAVTLVGLLQEAERLEVADWESYRINTWPAPRETVIRTVERLEDAIQAKKDRLAGLTSAPAASSAQVGF